MTESGVDQAAEVTPSPLGTHSSYPNTKIPDIIGEILTQYHVMQDLKLLRDLIIEIMSKGYYPVIFQKNLDLLQSPVEITEHGVVFSRRYFTETELRLLTKNELEEMGIDCLEYTNKILHDLNGFFQSSPTTARKEE